MEGEEKERREEGERGLTSTSLDCSLYSGPCPQHWAVSLPRPRILFCVVFVYLFFWDLWTGKFFKQIQN